ncbi:hypothetical protein, partial [Alcaligenes faecalis]
MLTRRSLEKTLWPQG